MFIPVISCVVVLPWYKQKKESNACVCVGGGGGGHQQPDELWVEHISTDNSIKLQRTGSTLGVFAVLWLFQNTQLLKNLAVEHAGNPD